MMIDYYTAKNVTPYFGCEVDNIKYLHKSEDNSITLHMYFDKKNYSKDEIDLFLQLTEKYYGTDKDTDGIFLEVGGNIGTTSIYVKKRKAPNIHVIAFEPSRENYKMFKTNLILNDIIEDDFTVENFAISNEKSFNKIVINKSNMGNCSIVDNEKSLNEDFQEIETIQSISLDAYIKEKKIKCSDIKYLWIDTEGYEAYVLDGALNIIREGDFPLFLEFSPEFVIQNNTSDLLLNNIKKTFTSFICTDKYLGGDKELHSIDDIDDLFNEFIKGQTNLFLMK